MRGRQNLSHVCDLVYFEFRENFAKFSSHKLRITGSKQVKQAAVLVVVLREVIRSVACGALKLRKPEQVECEQGRAT